MDEYLALWGRAEVIGPLGGGNRNTVLEVRIGRRRLAARRSRRVPASLDWEIALLDYLAGHGLRVPVAVPALDGHRHIDGRWPDPAQCSQPCREYLVLLSGGFPQLVAMQLAGGAYG